MTKALILAAGRGERLRPLTDKTPKCLVRFMGKSLLERQIATLNSQGITGVHIATGYCAGQIEALGFETSFNENFDSTNMVVSLFAALNYMETFQEDLIIGYGDIIYRQENLIKLLSCDEEVTLMIDKEWRSLWSMRFENVLVDAETLMMDSEGYITEIGKKPNGYERIQGQYTGLIKIRADKLTDFIRFYNKLDKSAIYDGKDFCNMYMTSLLQLMIDNSWKVKSAIVESGWLEIDSVDDLAKYEAMASKGNLKAYFDQ
jgi:choline kinase